MIAALALPTPQLEPLYQHAGTDPRLGKMLLRAQQIVEAHGVTVVDGGYRVRSQQDPRSSYAVRNGRCSCPSFQFDPVLHEGRPWCKHTLAILLNQTQPPVPPTERTSAPMPTPADTRTTGQLLNELIEQQKQTNQRLEQLVNMMQISAEQTEDMSKAFATYFHEAAQATHAQATASATAAAGLATRRNIVVYEATSLMKGIDSRSGKTTVSITAGEWQQFGVPAYPEVWPKLGFQADGSDIPNGTTPFPHLIQVQLTDEGKPKRVLGLVQES